MRMLKGKSNALFWRIVLVVVCGAFCFRSSGDEPFKVTFSITTNGSAFILDSLLAERLKTAPITYALSDRRKDVVFLHEDNRLKIDVCKIENLRVPLSLESRDWLREIHTDSLPVREKRMKNLSVSLKIGDAVYVSKADEVGSVNFSDAMIGARKPPPNEFSAKFSECGLYLDISSPRLSHFPGVPHFVNRNAAEVERTVSADISVTFATSKQSYTDGPYRFYFQYKAEGFDDSNKGKLTLTVKQ